MKQINIRLFPQYVRLTDEKEVINQKECHLHEVQKRMKLDFGKLPRFVMITAPTGTGKSYAFPFPVLEGLKNKKMLRRGIRGLIVLPTNALIEELYESFRKTYPQLKITKITGKTLDDFQVTGGNRWGKVMELAASCHIAITNPDIINYAMHGGYHQYGYMNNTGRREFHNFLQCFKYIIFDEYHLYDEAQVATIFTLINLRNVLLKETSPTKYFFVSATPEVGLKRLLQEADLPFEEIVEPIVASAENARAIHGELIVEFHKETLDALIADKYTEINREAGEGRKCLIILNELRAVQEWVQTLRAKFPDYRVEESSGYMSQEDKESHQRRIDEADIVVATNKAEVGVNYGVQYCIMQPGRYFSNFLQRFGRVSRGDLSGRVVISIDDLRQFGQLQKRFGEGVSLTYYDFAEKMREVLQDKKFYTEKVPGYLGEYYWCITRNMRENKQNFQTREIVEDERDCFLQNAAAGRQFAVFCSIQEALDALDKEYGYLPRVQQWKEWWKTYRNTYLRFREGSKVVKVLDARYGEVDYSLEWILQHKVILDRKVEEKKGYTVETYYVGDLKPKDGDLQYEIATIPWVGMEGNQLVNRLDIFHNRYTFDKGIQKVFGSALAAIDKKLKKRTERLDVLQRELVHRIKPLKSTFGRKRCEITGIEGNYNFL